MPALKGPKNSKLERVAAANSTVSTKTFTPRINEEIDNKLNNFIKENSKLVETVKSMPREYLERKYFLGKMQQQNRREAYTDKVAEWINAPEQEKLKTAYEHIVKKPGLSPQDHKTELVKEAKQYIRKAGIRLS